MAQRVEKLAQRRVEERNEKIKSARKTRFDIKSNPFFSRPSDTIGKESERLQQEQIEQLQQHILMGYSMDPSLSNNNQSLNTSITQSTNTFDGRFKINSPKIMKRTKKAVDLTDDDESGTPEGKSMDNNQTFRTNMSSTSSSPIKRSALKSATNRSVITTTELSVIGPIKKLKMIFPLNYKTKYRHLFLLDKIAYIYIQLVIMVGHKTMTGAQFRSFAK